MSQPEEMVAQLVADIIAGKLEGQPLPPLSCERYEDLRRSLLKEIDHLRDVEEPGGMKDTVLSHRLQESLEMKEEMLSRQQEAEFEVQEGGESSNLMEDELVSMITRFSDDKVWQLYDTLNTITRDHKISRKGKSPAEDSIAPPFSQNLGLESTPGTCSTSKLQPPTTVRTSNLRDHPDPVSSSPGRGTVAYIEKLQAGTKNMIRKRRRLLPAVPSTQTAWVLVAILVGCIVWLLKEDIAHLPHELWMFGGLIKQFGDGILLGVLNFLGSKAEAYLEWLDRSREVSVDIFVEPITSNRVSSLGHRFRVVESHSGLCVEPGPFAILLRLRCCITV